MQNASIIVTSNGIKLPAMSLARYQPKIPSAECQPKKKIWLAKTAAGSSLWAQANGLCVNI